MNLDFIARRPLANLSMGNTGTEPDVLMEAAEVMKQFGVNRQRVASIARARKWRYVKVGQSHLYYRVDVQAEAARRKEKGLQA